MTDTSQTIQKARISDDEKKLLQATFKDREELLLAMRNLFFGFNLTDDEKSLLSVIKGKEIARLLRKIFLPELQADIPIGQSIDLWMTVQIDNLEEVKLQSTARDWLIQMLGRALELLEDPDKEKLDLTVDPNSPEFHPHLISRNNFITHVEMQLNVIRSLANATDETEEEKEERLKKDSTE